MTIGIIGCGFVGSALKHWLERNNPSCVLRVYDPWKGYRDDVSDCDAYFIQIHVPTMENGTQDLSTLTEVINGLPVDKPIWVRSTILPGTAQKLTGETGRTVYFMPHFLTQVMFLEDFSKQPVVITGSEEHKNLLKQIFVNKEYIEMTSEEAELAKYAHNVFGALKITYFNSIYDICKKLNLDYSVVRQCVLSSSYVDPMHTNVPGPDGKFGYPGNTFSKDVNAMEKMFRYTPLGKLLDPLKKLNIEFRGEDR